MPEVLIPYRPRPLQMATHDAMDRHRFGALVCHRRFGKTVLAVNQLIKSALLCRRERPRFGYIAPTYSQGKAIAWDYLQHYTRPIPGATAHQSELRVDLPNGGQVRIYGGDNPDSLRGLYFDGVVLDEYGLHRPKVFTEVIAPALSDRAGWALFLGTPNGKNQFYEVVQRARQLHADGHPDWHFAEHKASETGYVAATELEAARSAMTEDEYEQEYECSFEASVRGAYYSKEMAAAEREGRITTVPIDPILPVDTDWDLGVGDAMAIWFSQSLRSGEVRIVDYYENSGEGFPFYIKILREKGYTYGKHWAPHDIQVRELTSGRSRLETAAALGLKFEIVPSGSLDDGIHGVRMLLPQCWFDRTRCQQGLEALKHYRKALNATLNEWKDTPVHDWACFTQDTLVLTRHGMRRIMDLPINGEVLTPCGWRAYEGPRITRRHAQLVAVTLSDGSTVRCTPDHKWLTASGWTSAEHLQPNTVIRSCSTRSRSTSMVGSIVSGLVNGITRVVESVSIALRGLPPSALYLADTTSTIGTRTPGTTTWTTSSASPLTHTPLSHIELRISPASAPAPEKLLPHGIGLTLGGSGIADTPSAVRVGRNGSGKIGRVITAAVSSVCSYVRAGISRSIARRHVRPLRIVAVTALPEREDVCCIHVPDVECFALANGAIVHNSHGADAFRMLAVRHEVPRERARASYAAPSFSGGSGWMA